MCASELRNSFACFDGPAQLKQPFTTGKTLLPSSVGIMTPEVGNSVFLAHDRLAAHGILTLHFAPRRVKTDAPGIVSELQSAIDKGLARPRLPITAVPQAA